MSGGRALYIAVVLFAIWRMPGAFIMLYVMLGPDTVKMFAFVAVLLAVLAWWGGYPGGGSDKVRGGGCRAARPFHFAAIECPKP